MSNRNIIFRQLTPGPECSTCPLAESPDGCLGFMALGTAQRVNGTYNELAERGDNASLIVQARMLGEAAALGTFTSAGNETFERVQEGLNTCPGEIVLPSMVFTSGNLSAAFSTKAMRDGKPEPIFTTRGSVINSAQHNKDAAYHAADIVNKTVKQVLAAASPAFQAPKLKKLA